MVDNSKKNVIFVLTIINENIMTTKETLETLILIEETMEYYDNKINELIWSNEFGAGQEFASIRNKNMHDIDISKRCMVRLNERFSKLVNTLK